jgi:PAS domain S-box-containing protein
MEELNANLERKVIEQSRERGVVWNVSLELLGGLNSKGYFESCNPAWHAVLGWSEAEVTSMSIFEMLHPDDVERTRNEFQLTQKGQPAIYFPNRFRHKDGSYRWISWVGVPEGEIVYCIGRDITTEREAAASLEAAQEQLRQAQKMEAVGQLTGGLAHDFNNLLAVISNSLELMQRRIANGKTADLDRYLDMAQSAAKRGAALTHRMLAFSRRQTLDPRPTEINRLIAGVEDLVRRVIDPSVELEVVGSAGLWTVNVDAHQLESALLNLCINARDAMPNGGRLRIESANKWVDERTAAERQLEPGEYVSICVTDTGTGMDAVTQKRIFEPFFTTKPIGMGTGLGLSMVYGFAAQSGGQVRVDSELGMGTTMCIYLPRFLGEVEHEAALPRMNESSAESGRVVLVVDDEASVRTIVSEVIKDLGHSCLEAEEGAQALSLLRSTHQVDLLITDVGLPGGMNGRQVADAARQFNPELKVLFITGYAENAVVGNGHLDPGMEVLTKPFEIDAIAARASGMLSRE